MTERTGPVAAGLVGLKGAVFAETAVMAGAPRLDAVVSYRQAGDASDGFERIRAAAAAAGWRFTEGRQPAEPADLVLLVGWQHLLRQAADEVVVLHDSLLPDLRGFAPTVAALLRGDVRLGVTAFRPSPVADEGPVLGQRSAPIRYPITIEAALVLQARLMAELAADVVAGWRAGVLRPREQDHSAATYSLWRDEADYHIDWARPAAELARFVDAVGYPYAGACCTVRPAGDILRVRAAEALPDLPFTARHVGKAWHLDEGRPVVVCGEGLLRLNRVEGPDGAPYRFERLRVRFGGERA